MAVDLTHKEPLCNLRSDSPPTPTSISSFPPLQEELQLSLINIIQNGSKIFRFRSSNMRAQEYPEIAALPLRKRVLSSHHPSAARTATNELSQ